MAFNAPQIIEHAAQAYHTDDRLLRAVNRLENGGKMTFDVNNWDSNAKRGTPSAGPFQFIKPTFDAFSRQARQANPGAWRGVAADWKSPEAQALTASWAFANGHGGDWSTYGRAQKLVGGMSHLSGTGSPATGPTVTSPATSAPAPAADGRKAMALSLIFGDDPVMSAILSAGQQNAAPTPSVVAQVKTSAPAKGSIGKDYRWLQQQGEKLFGLRNDPGDSQTTGGKHTANSEHYRGRAIDFGTARNSASQLAAWAKWAKSQGLDVLNEGDHYHVSLPGQGI